MNAIQQLLTEHIGIWTDADTEKKSGRGRSSGNAASVYGIRKLRELILELAVRGKLVPQDANDEPAHALLKRIQAEKAGLIAEGKIKKDKPLLEISEDEKPFEAPLGWAFSRLGVTGRYINGLAFKPSDWGDQGLPIIRIQNLSGRNTEFNYTTREVGEDVIVEPGEMLVSWSATLDVFIWNHKSRGVLNQHIFRVAPSTLLNERFLFWLLTHSIRRLAESDHAHGLVMSHINRGDFLELPVVLPPLAEQHRIVAKVDELMALCDQLETRHNNAAAAHEKLVSHLLGTLTQSKSPPFAKGGLGGDLDWQRIAAHFDTLFTTEASIDALKQTLLQLAVMGKLVPQDPNDEPASVLLKRIQAEKARLIAEGKIKKDKPLPPITEDEKPFELPVDWAWARMIDCAKQITDGEHLTPQRTPDITKIPLVTAKNVRDGNMDYTNTDYVDFDVATKCWNRCKPELNDILIVSVGATIGRLTIVDDHRDMVIVRSVTLVKPILINIPYLALALRSPFLQASIWSGVKQNAQPCLYLSVSNSLPIPLPPIEEQHRIVAKVDELMALCNQLKTRLTAANQLQQKLADVMVEQAIA